MLIPLWIIYIPSHTHTQYTLYITHQLILGKENNKTDLMYSVVQFEWKREVNVHMHSLPLLRYPI